MSKNFLLIVEDDIGLQKQLKWSFDRYEILLAGDRGQALQLFKQFLPEVVILDLGLPPDPTNASEGLRTITEILESSPTTKIIVVSGNNDRHNANQAIQLGAYDFYQKPIDPEILGEIIDKAFLVSSHHQQTATIESNTDLPSKKESNFIN